MGRVILFGLLVAVTLYALVDCIRTPRDMMPAKLPKALWLLLILLFSPIGPIAWIIVSRVAAAEDKGGRFEPTVWSSRDSVPLSFGREKPAADAPQAPDDDPEFLESLERKVRDKKRREYQRRQREKQEKRDSKKKQSPRPGENSQPGQTFRPGEKPHLEDPDNPESYGSNGSESYD